MRRSRVDDDVISKLKNPGVTMKGGTNFSKVYIEKRRTKDKSLGCTFPRVPPVTV